MERCDGYQAGVLRYGKVRQLSGSVTVLRRCVSWWEVSWSWDEVKGLEEVYHLAGSVTVNRELLNVLKSMSVDGEV